MQHLKEKKTQSPSYKLKVEFMSNKMHPCSIEYTEGFGATAVHGLVWPGASGG